MIPGLRTYRVNPSARQPLIDYMTGGLRAVGCRIIHTSTPDLAPFVLVIETPARERIGVVAYAFLATRTPTTNRPADERSFQIKYGSKQDYADDNVHELWQDPLGMFTTVLLGIDPAHGYCVSADPVIHSPTKFFIRLELKDEHARRIQRDGWAAWERAKRSAKVGAARVETLVGATREHFLDLVRFERAARGLEPGNRLILAEHHALSLPRARPAPPDGQSALIELAATHPLVEQFALSPDEILDLIAGARRLRMAVRGWVAEEHLHRTLAKLSGITHCERLDEEGGPDLRVAWRNGPLLSIECKNVAREPDRHGNPRIDFQRTRAAKGNPCSRYYEPTEFDIVAACLHAVTQRWDFRYVVPTALSPHTQCEDRIASNIRVDSQWTTSIEEIFRQAYTAQGAVA